METNNLENLSKEELLALLKKNASQPPLKSNPTPSESVDTKHCLFVAKRGVRKSCPLKALEFGYCQQHAKTLEGRQAKEAWEEERKAALLEIEERKNKKTNDSDDERDERKKTDERDERKKTDERDERRDERKKTDERDERKKTDERDERKKTDERDERKKTDERESSTPKDVSEKKKVTRSIRKNAWGYFEDTETGLVFNPMERCVYGYQNHETGEILPLTPEHIEICKERNYKWTVPKKSKPESVKKAPVKPPPPDSSDDDDDDDDDDDEEEEDDDEEEEEEEEEPDEEIEDDDDEDDDEDDEDDDDL